MDYWTLFSGGKLQLHSRGSLFLWPLFPNPFPMQEVLNFQDGPPLNLPQVL